MGDIQTMCDMYMDEAGIPMLMTMSKESFDLCSKIQESIIYNWCYNDGFLSCEAEYNTDLVHWTHGILMECYIFMTDGLLDLVHSCVDSLIESQSLCGTSMLVQS